MQMYLNENVTDFCFKIIHITINHNLKASDLRGGTNANTDI